MKPESKMFALILGYCSIMWLTNWSVSHKNEGASGGSFSVLDLRIYGVLFGVFAVLVLFRRIWRIVRELLDARIRIPRTARLRGTWHYLWFLWPLAPGFTRFSWGLADDGTPIETIFEYGGGISWVSILCTALVVMLFQFLVNLEAFLQHHRSTPLDALPQTSRS